MKGDSGEESRECMCSTGVKMCRWTATFTANACYLGSEGDGAGEVNRTVRLRATVSVIDTSSPVSPRRLLTSLLGWKKGEPIDEKLGRSGEPDSSRKIGVGIAGTFDVENYGDLLFPLMAEAALLKREPAIQVIPFSPNRRSEQSWPFRVYSTADMPDVFPSLSAVLIGGGQIIRFDKRYPAEVEPSVNLPIAYWLIPAALGALIGKPVIWNSIGAWTGSPAAPWYDDAVNTVLCASHFVGVRDEVTQLHLSKTAPAVDIQLVPDTVFSVSHVWPLADESSEYALWRESLGIEGRYAVIQADHAIANYGAVVQNLLGNTQENTAVILPICWCHGDRADGLLELNGKAIGSPSWLSPRLISEIIGRSELVIATSLHACITGLSYGVPVIRVPGKNATDRKFELLDEFEGVASILNPEAAAALVQRGRKVEPRVIECADRLDQYWDLVLEVVLNPHTHDSKRSMALMLGWASRVFADLETAGQIARQAEASAV